MNERWHIPRPSLSGSSSGGISSNGSNKSHSNPSTVNRNSRYLRQEGQLNYGYVSAYDIYSNQEVSRYPRGSTDIPELHASGSNISHKNIHQSHHQQQKLYNAPNTMSSSASSRRDRLNQIRKQTTGGSGDKRGSRSSRGSTDSNSSSHSGTSESLLLTAANLERFTAIQNSKNQQSVNGVVRQNYNANITTTVDSAGREHNTLQQQSMTSENKDAIIAIDPNLQFVKTKDVDSVSIASSTHFTMVNGIGRPPRKVKSGICSRSHQITVLITTMSTFFLIGIMLAIYLLEMRARSMPR